MELIRFVPSYVPSGAATIAARDLAHAHHPVECFQTAGVQKVVLVDVGAVEEHDERVGDGRVVARRQVNVEIARPPQDGRADPPVGAVVLGIVDHPAAELAVEVIEIDPD